MFLARWFPIMWGLSAVFLILVFPLSALGETHVGGTISANQTWTELV